MGYTRKVANKILVTGHLTISHSTYKKASAAAGIWWGRPRIYIRYGEIRIFATQARKARDPEFGLAGLS